MLFCIFLCSQVSFSYPSPSLLLKLPNIAFYSGHAIRPAVGTLYSYNITRKKLQGKRNCFRKELNFKKNHMYTSLVCRIDSPLKNNFLLNIFISCFHHPESASEVSAESEFPAHLIKYQWNCRTKFTDDRDLLLVKLVLTEESDTWLLATSKWKQSANDNPLWELSSV